MPRLPPIVLMCPVALPAAPCKLAEWLVAGADWGFQPAKTPTKQSGARLPVSGASSPLAAAPAAKPGPGSPAWQAWPGGGSSSNQGTPVRQPAVGGGDASRDPICAPPPRRQPNVQSIARPLGSTAISGTSSVGGANEVSHWIVPLSGVAHCPQEVLYGNLLRQLLCLTRGLLGR